MAETRKSGIDVLGNVPWGTHVCQFCGKGDDPLELLIPYFAAGLAAGEFCLWITSPPVSVADARAALAEVVPELEDCFRREQIEIISSSDWYDQNGAFSVHQVLDLWKAKLRNALDRGCEGMRFCAMVTVADKTQLPNFARYAERLDSLISAAKAIALCTHFVDESNTAGMLDVLPVYEIALAHRDGQWVRLEPPGSKRTERLLRHSQQTLRENEAKFRGIAERSFDAIFTSDTQGTLTYLSPAAENTFQFKPRK